MPEQLPSYPGRMGKPSGQQARKTHHKNSNRALQKERRYANHYRFPPEFIARWTRICSWVLVGALVLGIGSFAAGVAMDDAADRTGDDTLSFLAFLVIMFAAVIGGGGVAFSFGTAAYLGGAAIARHGGWLGILLTVGLVSIVVGAVTLPIVMNIGFWIVGLAVVGVFIIGIRAGVPIWFNTDRQ